MCMQVSVLYTAPTAIRSLMAKGDGPVTKHKRSSLRILGTVGEPINPEAWRWYYEVGLSCLHTAISQQSCQCCDDIYRCKIRRSFAATFFMQSLKSAHTPPPCPCFILLPVRNSILSVSCVM